MPSFLSNQFAFAIADVISILFLIQLLANSN